MKNYFWILPFAVLLAMCGGTQQLPDELTTVQGTLTNALVGDSIYLEIFENGNTKRTVDRAAIAEDGTFRMGYKAPKAGFYCLSMDNGQQVNLILDASDKLNYSGNAETLDVDYTIAGSEESKRLQRLNSALRLAILVQDSVKKLQPVYSQSRNIAALQKLNMRQAMVNGQATLEMRTLIKEKPGSLCSIVALQQLQDPSKFYDEFEQVEQAMAQEMPGSEYHTFVTQALAPFRATRPGQAAPEIMLNDPDGNPVRLSSLRGKVVLIDFWASWCKPCRRENPNVVRLYNTYNPKGFEVFSVSLDNDHNRWLKAIEADGLAWTHVSDLKGWKSAAGRLYNVSSIPATFLIDREGKIIESGLRGDALESKLQDLFQG